MQELVETCRTNCDTKKYNIIQLTEKKFWQKYALYVQFQCAYYALHKKTTQYGQLVLVLCAHTLLEMWFLNSTTDAAEKKEGTKRTGTYWTITWESSEE